MADLHRTAAERVDLRRLTGQATPTRHVEVAERDQALEMLEGHGSVHPRLAGHFLYAARLAIGVEAKQDVAAREVTQRPQGALHVPSHSPQHRTALGLDGLS